MSIVSNTDEIVRQAGRWNPADVAFLRRVVFENVEVSSFDLALEVLIQPRPDNSAGWPNIDRAFWEATILFREVQELVLTIVRPWDIQTPGFVIEDIRDRQWDRQNLRVFDTEHLTEEGIRFNAWSAEVRGCRQCQIPPRFRGIWKQFPGKYA